MYSDPDSLDRREIATGKPIDGQTLKSLVEAGLTWLRTNQQIVNSLNVFPVPDGDTGTNMVLTMQAAYDEIVGLPEQNFGKMAHAVAHGALMGARGNSGVILSQLWRGFARGVDNIESLDAKNMVQAFGIARDTAYKGVVRPVEGTILTVAKDSAHAAEQALMDTVNLVDILEQVVQAAEQSVERTPELLPVLKEAGVVDSGGKGLFFILEGMLRYIHNLPLDISKVVLQPLASLNLEDTLGSIEPGQDFEVVIDFRPHATIDLPTFYDTLQEMGTSIQVGEGDGIYRLHIHVPTEKLYHPIEYTRSLGVVTKAAIENLVAQMEALERECSEGSLTFTPLEPGQIAVVAVAPGSGIARIFASLGVTSVVPGGQTMNPSTQEIINAFESLPTDRVIILPNNKNIIMTARAAAEMTAKKTAVIPSRSVPQGLSAMFRLIPDGDFDEVVEEMTSALNEVQTGEITFATRDVDIDGVDVHEGEYIALHNGRLVRSTKNIEEATLGLLEAVGASDYELITFFYGSDISKREANRIIDLARAAYPAQEIEVQEGCQPHYYFIISIE